jgi:hypothetical protein
MFKQTNIRLKNNMFSNVVQAVLRVRITLMRIRIIPFTLIWIRILLLIDMIRISDHWSRDSFLILHASIASVHGPPWLYFLASTAPEF